jgi:hypothetical protein
MSTTTTEAPTKAPTTPMTDAGGGKFAEFGTVLAGTPTTPEEMEKYEKYLDHNYVRVNEHGNPINVANPTGRKLVPSKEEFFYKVVGCFMRYFGLANTAEGVMRFNVQKYYGDRQVKDTDSATGRPKVIGHEQVKSHVFDPAQQVWLLVDADASFPIDCADFDKQFKLE